jgi:arylsulfatase A-like enzyme
LRFGRRLAGLLLLAAASPLTAAPARRTENVILVTTDGLRWQEVFGGGEEPLFSKDAGVSDVDALRRDFWRETPEARRQALLPFFWSVVAKQGQVFGNRQRQSAAKVTNGHNFSYPGYNELLSGRADPRVDSNDKKPNPNVTVLEWLQGRQGYRDRVAAFGSWDVFPWIINRQRSGVMVNAGFEAVEAPGERMAMLNELMAETTPPVESVRHDSFTFLAALEHLRRAQPRVLYLALGETDDWAHAGRYDLYLQAARRFDRCLRRLWDVVQSLPQYRDQTALVITTDHGRGAAAAQAWKGHGAKVPGAEDIWIAVLGPDTPPQGERGGDAAPVTQSQVAATVAALLGEDFAAAQPGVAAPIADVLPAAR